MKMKVNADEALFCRWKEISVAISHLKSIVQNDMHISSRQFDVWKRQANQARLSLDKLTEATTQHVLKCNEP